MTTFSYSYSMSSLSQFSYSYCHRRLQDWKTTRAELIIHEGRGQSNH